MPANQSREFFKGLKAGVKKARNKTIMAVGMNGPGCGC